MLAVPVRAAPSEARRSGGLHDMIDVHTLARSTRPSLSLSSSYLSFSFDRAGHFDLIESS
jgi:hypothetical protein